MKRKKHKIALMEHYKLALMWAKYNGLQGTEKQVRRIMKQLSYFMLFNMLKVRGQL